MTKPKRIGILTGGGDVPGLNAVIKSVVYRATELGYEVIGIRRGWEGLTHVQPELPDGGGTGYLRPLDRINTRTIDRTGGTILHTSRTNPRKMRAAALPPWLSAGGRGAATRSRDGIYDLTPLVLENIEALGHRLPGARSAATTRCRTRRSWPTPASPLMAIPKTMDNDVQGTEYCIGFSTAITRAKEAINRQRTTLGSHERIGVFRIFGRDAGFSALYTAYVTSARCVIPEAPYDLDALAALLAADHAANPSHYAFVITAEGAIWQGAQMTDVGEADAFGHRHKANVGEALAEELAARTGIETLASELTYDLRSGEPDSLDSMVATTFANVAMDLVAGRRHRPDGRHPGRQVRAHRPARPGARARARSTSRSCTTPSASGPATRASSATRCCWSASTSSATESDRWRWRGGVEHRSERTRRCVARTQRAIAAISRRGPPLVVQARQAADRAREG